jgi:iron complex outermembrane receptor protein
MNQNVSAFAILSKGFSPPTLAEIRPSTNQFYNLQPEYGWNVEGGLKGNILNNRLAFQASVYSFHLSRAIVQQQDSSGADFFVNAGSTRQSGVELWLQASLVKNNNRFIRNMEVSNSFAYQPYTFGNYISGTKNLSGNRLTGVPRCVNVVQLDIGTKTGIYLNTNYTYTASIPLTDANDVYAGSYHLWQCKLGYMFPTEKISVNFYVGADNLLNKTYSLGNDLNAFGGRFFNPAPKRNYFLGAKIEL